MLVRKSERFIVTDQDGAVECARSIEVMIGGAYDATVICASSLETCILLPDSIHRC